MHLLFKIRGRFRVRWRGLLQASVQARALEYSGQSGGGLHWPGVRSAPRPLPSTRAGRAKEAGRTPNPQPTPEARAGGAASALRHLVADRLPATATATATAPHPPSSLPLASGWSALSYPTGLELLQPHPRRTIRLGSGGGAAAAAGGSAATPGPGPGSLPGFTVLLHSSSGVKLEPEVLRPLALAYEELHFVS